LNSQAIWASASRSRQAKDTFSGNQPGAEGRREKWNKVRIGVAPHEVRENAHARRMCDGRDVGQPEKAKPYNGSTEFWNRRNRKSNMAIGSGDAFGAGA